MMSHKKSEKINNIGRVWGIFINVRVVHLSLAKGDGAN
jgi:hypothetical protein